jgi:hypothetical protein
VAAQRRGPGRSPELSRTRLAAASPARYACYLAAIVGVVLVLHAGQTLSAAAGPPAPYAVSVGLAGLVQLLLVWFVLQGNRIAWSFLVSLNGTLAVVSLFGATKIRDMLEVPMLLALLPCLAVTTICVLAALAHREF